MIHLPNFKILNDSINTLYKSVNTHVYRAIKTDDNKAVILKTTSNSHPSSSEIARFVHEFNILKKFKSTGSKYVVNIIDFIMNDHKPYLIMEDFGGIDLKIVQRNNEFSVEQVLDISVKVASALSELYKAHIIHKDIKPSNILYNMETGILKLIDFSSASIISRETPTIESSMLMIATLPYMSPEQTGRMNRLVDWRTDYYSFGVTLYELLTRELPFKSVEPIELVHAHLALIPKPPHKLNPSVYYIISEIVFKLMEKDAQNRYQSAFGIKYDLQYCLAQYCANRYHINGYSINGKNQKFQIGQKDISNRLRIPQKLYGREAEIQILLKGFEKVSQGSCKMVLVTGQAGIGKSALVHEVQRPIVQQLKMDVTEKPEKEQSLENKRRYFISGKFDQLKKSIPYAPLIQAFKELIRQILAESDDQILRWKEKLLESLGANGQVIIEIIPEVELIIGKQLEVPILGPVENVNRFNYVFEKFINSFADKAHPLIIFLDDLQWADLASLKLIEMFIITKTRYLYFIGAYRDNEVDHAHPLTLTIKEIEKSGADIENIIVPFMTQFHVSQLISETLLCSLEESKTLAKLCFQKTRGNPFFLSQFINSLYQEKLIDFNDAKLLWQWDADKIKQADITDNVVDLMINKIQKLSKDTVYILSLASCIGNKFDLYTLSIVYEKSIQETADDLYEALQAELILPVDESYKYILNLDCDTQSYIYKFLHDRVQQAAYLIIEENQKQKVHLKIGRQMLNAISQKELEDHIFDIVDQFNVSHELITDEKEREKLAQLNLSAGKKAKLSAAFNLAFSYLKIGIEMLNENSWQMQYKLSLSLYDEITEAAYLCGNIEEVENFAQTVLEKAKTVIDKIKVYEVKIQANMSQHKLQEAVQTGLFALKVLKVDFPDKPNKAHILKAYLKTKFALIGKNPDNLIEKSEITDPYILAQMRIITTMLGPVYATVPNLLPLLIFKGVNLSVKYGYTSRSIIFYNGYGLILCGVVGDIESGFKFGQTALQLLKKLNAQSFEVNAKFVFNYFIRHWKRPLRETLEPLEAGFQQGLKIGDFEYAASSAMIFSTHSYFAGIKLLKLKDTISKSTDTIKKIKQLVLLYHNERIWQIILNLMGYSNNPVIITGDIFNEEKNYKLCIERNDEGGICCLHIDKLFLSYLFYEYDLAVESAAIAEKHLMGLMGGIAIPCFYFYDSLAQLALFFNSSKKTQILKKVNSNQKKMKKWAYHAPMNYLHKWQLVEAERNRILKKNEQAIKFYNLAIAGAKKNLYIQEEAIANELLAKFYLENSNLDNAKKHIREARYCYESWGAKAKVTHLNRKYPQLLNQEIIKSSQKLMDKDNKICDILTTTVLIEDEQLDLTSVMKASQVISSEMQIDKLLSNMIRIIIENAGAQTGYLVLKSCEKLLIEAHGDISQNSFKVLQSISIKDSLNIPITIIQYVARSMKSLVQEDIVDNEKFLMDPYIVKCNPKSFLCAPLIHQNSLKGIIYLENKLVSGAFTKERFKVILLLCSQAAISLENANLYKQQQDYSKILEEKVEERTYKLKQSLETIEKTRDQLVQSEKMAALGGLVAGVAHEVNTPIGIAVTAASYLENKTTEFIEKVKSKKLKRSDMDKYAEIAGNSSNLVLKNLSGAVKIIQGFKQVAVDQTSEERREFQFKEYIEDVLLSLQPKLKKTKHTVKVNCPESLLLNSFPGAFSQIISNLVINSLIHGFENIETGEMEFEVIDNKNMIVFIYRDNGKGMKQQELVKIFDPFFTTKRSQGGSGLGMHVVHNLVTSTLGGTILCNSKPQNGIEFKIEIPK